MGSITLYTQEIAKGDFDIYFSYLTALCLVPFQQQQLGKHLDVWLMTLKCTNMQGIGSDSHHVYHILLSLSVWASIVSDPI